MFLAVRSTPAAPNYLSVSSASEVGPTAGIFGMFGARLPLDYLFEVRPLNGQADPRAYFAIVGKPAHIKPGLLLASLLI